MNKLIIFDLDGTLFDTTQVNYQAYNAALKEFGEKEIEYSYFVNECSGRHYTFFLPEIIATKKHTKIDKVHKRKKELYSTYLSQAIPNRFLIDIVKNMKNDYRFAIVTTASRKNTIELLNYFELTYLFELILTQEDVEKTKPDPEGFLAAMEYFGVTGKDTIIFEDSAIGIEAANKTGSAIIKINKF